MEPSSTESSSLYISDFACALIMKLGHELTPVVSNLCATLLNRLEVGKSSVYIRCILTVYLHLLYHPNLFQVAFDVLKADQGKLQYFVDAWISLFPEFQPLSHFKTSVLVMLKVLTMADPVVSQLIVKGDPINVDSNAEASGRIITRSRAKSSSVRYQMIPFPVKGIQLILNDLKETMLSNKQKLTNNMASSRTVVTHEEILNDDEDDDEDWEDVEPDEFRDIPVDLLFNPDSALDDSPDQDEEEK